MSNIIQLEIQEFLSGDFLKPEKLKHLLKTTYANLENFVMTPLSYFCLFVCLFGKVSPCEGKRAGLAGTYPCP